MKYQNILETIGKTSHLNISKLFPTAQKKHITVWMKMEKENPGGSIKDRIALNMILQGQADGKLTPGKIIVEPTSGNTGIGLAMVGAVLGYQVILVMPESMSIERRKIMQVYGAQLVLTPKELGMKGAIAKATEIAQERNGWMPMQFENDANVAIHRETTALEIWQDFGAQLDYLITGVGTGGHITGVGQVLKAKIPHLQVWAVEPANSPVLSGGQHSPHVIQGIGAGFVPPILDRKLIDGIIQVENAMALLYASKCARELGILVGISTGASLNGVEQKLQVIAENSTILTFNYDTGERYLSMEQFG